ncbi:MAG: hypothetical protein QOE38_1859 [Thermoleophilaceae bacterium]|nr:hypothetical protein [Thermoleophilaceae bacterium]
MQRAARVPAAVDSLGRGGRALLLLAYHHGLSDADIARRARIDPRVVAAFREEQLDEVAAATGLRRRAVAAGLDYVSLPGPASAAPPRTPAAATALAPRSRSDDALAALGYRVPLALIVLLSVVSVVVALSNRSGRPQSLDERGGPQPPAVQVAANPKHAKTPTVPRRSRPSTATGDNTRGSAPRPRGGQAPTPAPSPRFRVMPAGHPRPGSVQHSSSAPRGEDQRRGPASGVRTFAKPHSHSRGGARSSAPPPRLAQDRQPGPPPGRGRSEGHRGHGRPPNNDNRDREGRPPRHHAPPIHGRPPHSPPGRSTRSHGGHGHGHGARD